MIDIYVSIMKAYQEIGSELNELGSMVHILFGVIYQSYYTTGTPSLAFLCDAGMKHLPLVQYALEANHLVFIGVVYTRSIPV